LESKNISASFVGDFQLGGRPVRNKERRAEISLIYQMVDRGVEVAANLAAFASACPLLVAALRGACHPKQIHPGDAEAQFGTQDFLLPK
jgi:hypothetical protein